MTLYWGPPDAEMNSSAEGGKANPIKGIEFSGGTGSNYCGAQVALNHFRPAAEPLFEAVDGHRTTGQSRIRDAHPWPG